MRQDKSVVAWIAGKTVLSMNASDELTEARSLNEGEFARKDGFGGCF